MLQGASGLINHGSCGGKVGKACREETLAEFFPLLCRGCAVDSRVSSAVPQFTHMSDEGLDSPLRIAHPCPVFGACKDRLTEFLVVSPPPRLPTGLSNLVYSIKFWFSYLSVTID